MPLKINFDIGKVIFFIAIVIMLINPFLATNQSINDADPATYVIVPVIMLPFLALFSFKNKIEPKVEKNDMVLGIILFVIFLILILYLEFAFSFEFLSYRLDMLVLPLAISSLLLLTFGSKNIKSFKMLLVYPILASPIVLGFALLTNSGFAVLNSVLVYNILHLFSSAIKYTPPISISAGAYTIGIGTACAGVAVFIALVLFLMPVAYYLNGKIKHKLYWIVAAFVLLLLLNFLRMASVAGIWLLYGPNATVAYIHTFVGILIFYATIIIAILGATRCGLSFPKWTKGKKKQYKNKESCSSIMQ